MLSLASCAKEKHDDELAVDNRTLPSKSEYIISFDIQSVVDVATRAGDGYSDLDDAGNGDFVYGSEDEHKLIGEKGNYVFFFSENKNKGGELELVAISDVVLSTHRHNTGGSEGVRDENDKVEDNIEARYESRFDVEDEMIPSACLLLLNGRHFEEQLNSIREALADEAASRTYTVQDILSVLTDKVDKQGDPHAIGFDDDEYGRRYFTMSNSIYVKDGALQTAVPIPDGFIQQKNTYDPDKVLTIYVERMVAKFTFEIADHDSEDRTVFVEPAASPLILFTGFESAGHMTFSAVPWRVQLKGWGINALETQNNVFRQIEAAPTSEKGYPGAWQDASNYRTYWSTDPHYDEKTYPWQFRNMYDRTYGTGGRRDYPAFDYYGHRYEDASEQNILRNYSYNEFKALSQQDFDRVVYTPENTYNYLYEEDTFNRNLDGREHLLAGTHLLVGAELQTDFESVEGEESGFKAHDLFRDRSGIYYMTEEDCFRSLVHSFNRTLSSQSSMSFTYFNWDGDESDARNGKTYVIRPTADGDFYLFFDDDKVAYDSDYSKYHMCPATIKDGDGKRLPWPANVRLSIINSSSNRPLSGIYEPRAKETDEWGQPITGFQIDQNVIKSLMYEWLGAVDHYSDGKMYYSAPVTNPRSGTDQNPFYGVVRNNWYRFVLSGVHNLGTSVDDPDQPIIPLVVETHDQLNVRIRILDWHEFETTAPFL